MQFMTSSSNRALMRADWRRFWPLVFSYAALWLCVLPLSLWNRRTWVLEPRRERMMESISDYLHGASAAAVIISACFAVLLAMALFAYLTNSRSTGLMHALPVTRGQQFAVHFFVGFQMFTLVHLATALLSLLVQAGLGVVCLRYTLGWLLAAEVSSLFFFALAALCTMITGWLLAIPVIYAGVNFVFAAFYLLYSAMASMFWWGYDSMSWPVWLDWLTPVVRMFRMINSYDEVVSVGTGADSWYYWKMSSTTWTALLVYTVVAVLLIAAAYFFYRARPSEGAGDAIVFRWLRPVVLYVISLAGGMGLGYLVWFLLGNMESFPLLLGSQIVAGLVVYFGVQMLLHKSFRVFDRRGWLGSAILAAALVLIGLVMRYDLFGIAKYVPDADRVESVSVYAHRYQMNAAGLMEPETIEKVLAVHRALLEQGADDPTQVNEPLPAATSSDADGDSDTDVNVDSVSIALEYEMADGSSVRRYYPVFVVRGTPLHQALNDLFNTPDVRRKVMQYEVSIPTIDPNAITGGLYSDWSDDSEECVPLSDRQARQLYQALSRYVEDSAGRQVDVLTPQQRKIDFCLEFTYRPEGDTAVGTDAVWNVDVPGDCTEVVDLLVSFGLVGSVNEQMADN